MARDRAAHDVADRPAWISGLEDLVPFPEARVWTRVSQRALIRALDESMGRQGATGVHIGAGFETVMSRALDRYPQILCVGLPHRGRVDVRADFRALPFADDTVDLLFSSSVLEHVDGVEEAVSETARVLRPGGLTYAEVPFIRAFHMAPRDYQRFTRSGLVRLFERHGFECLEVGICSGPFTSWVLLIRDAVVSLTPTMLLKGALKFLVGWALHPIKYLDRGVEQSAWAVDQACNFYFLGRLPAPPRAP